jgi:8-oxo-dGTP pyrophosphatase MutT (NUDIX family)
VWYFTSGGSEGEALRGEAAEEIGLRSIKYKFIGRFIFNRFVKAKNRQENYYLLMYWMHCDGRFDPGSPSSELHSLRQKRAGGETCRP